MKKDDNIAGLSILINLALSLGKILAGIATSSVSIIASGIHSGLDLMASILAFYSASQSAKPADDEHQYGHGKYQNVTAVAEALFIIVAVIIIFKKALPTIMQGKSTILHSELGIAVMGIAAIISFSTSAVLASAYHRTMQEAFWENHRHLMVNGAASAVVCLGLAAVRFTGLNIIDPILALLITLLLLREGYRHLKKSVGGIFDVRLSPEEERIIREVLSEHRKRFVQYHA
ncbi:MAG: cation diffusion facilitator family transporter, partial [Bacillota bacterium]